MRPNNNVRPLNECKIKPAILNAYIGLDIFQVGKVCDGIYGFLVYWTYHNLNCLYARMHQCTETQRAYVYIRIEQQCKVTLFK